jgi:hypothetical protein
MVTNAFCGRSVFESLHSCIPGLVFFFGLDTIDAKQRTTFVEQDVPDAGAESYIWKYFADIHDHGEEGCSKNLRQNVFLQCKFCDKTFSVMPTTWNVDYSVSSLKSCTKKQLEIHAKWSKWWVDLPLHGAGHCLDPEFHDHDHSMCSETLADLCDRVHGAGSVSSAKAQLEAAGLAFLVQGEERNISSTKRCTQTQQQCRQSSGTRRT